MTITKRSEKFTLVPEGELMRDADLALHTDNGDSRAGSGRQMCVKATARSMPDGELLWSDDFIRHVGTGDLSSGDNGRKSGDGGDWEPWGSTEEVREEDDSDDEGDWEP